MKHIESKIQQAAVLWYRLQFPHLATLLFAVPNGGRRNIREAAIMKGEGVTAGVADLLLLVPNGEYHGLAIEMKTDTGRQNVNQKQWQKKVESQGYKYIVCRSFDEFRSEVCRYLKFKERR